MWCEVLLRLCPSVFTWTKDGCTDKCTNTTGRMHNSTASKVIVAYVCDSVLSETCQLRVPQKEVGKRSSVTFFRFRDSFGHFLVTFSDASLTFFITFLPNSFCRTPLRQGDQPFAWFITGVHGCPTKVFFQ